MFQNLQNRVLYTFDAISIDVEFKITHLKQNPAF